MTLDAMIHACGIVAFFLGTVTAFGGIFCLCAWAIVSSARFVYRQLLSAKSFTGIVVLACYIRFRSRGGHRRTIRSYSLLEHDALVKRADRDADKIRRYGVDLSDALYDCQSDEDVDPIEKMEELRTKYFNPES